MADAAGLRLRRPIPRRMPRLLLLFGLVLGPMTPAHSGEPAILSREPAAPGVPPLGPILPAGTVLAGAGRHPETTPADARGAATTSRQGARCMDKETFLRALQDEFRSLTDENAPIDPKAFRMLRGLSWPELGSFFDCFGSVSRYGPALLHPAQRDGGILEVMVVDVEVAKAPVPLFPWSSEMVDLPVLARIAGTLYADQRVTVSGIFMVDAP